jgi:hypothetical protein
MRRRNKWNNVAIVEWDNSFGGNGHESMERVIEECKRFLTKPTRGIRMASITPYYKCSEFNGGLATHCQSSIKPVEKKYPT